MSADSADSLQELDAIVVNEFNGSPFDEIAESLHGHFSKSSLRLKFSWNIKKTLMHAYLNYGQIKSHWQVTLLPRSLGNSTLCRWEGFLSPHFYDSI